jgi:hypothetical protein
LSVTDDELIPPPPKKKKKEEEEAPNAIILQSATKAKKVKGVHIRIVP